MAKKEQIAFLLQKDQKEIVDELTNEEAGIIFKAIYEYETTKRIPNLDKTLRIVFKQFKIKLDMYDEAYELKCLKNKENIEKRWGKKSDTNEYERIRMNTNDTNKKKINKKKINKIKTKENKLNKNNINNKIKENINNSESENKGVAIATAPTLDSILQYGLEFGIDGEYCERFFNHYESIGWVNGTGQQIKNWKLIFKNWIKKDNVERNIQKIGEGVFKI